METLDNPQAFIPDYSGWLCDKRLEKRATALFRKLSLSPSSSIQQLSSSRAEQKANYRLLNNERVKESQLIAEAWKLLTTHQIENFEQALQIVNWYSARWYIEQLFQLLKKQSFGIESVKLESGWAIRKLVVLQMVALLKILQMNIAYAVDEGQPIEEVFESDQIEALELMNVKLQRKTQKLQNKYDHKGTKWAAWVVGRMGGWKGYDSQSPLGVITLIIGMERLGYIIEGMKLTKDVVGIETMKRCGYTVGLQQGCLRSAFTMY